MKRGHINVTIDEKYTLKKLPAAQARHFIKLVNVVAKTCAKHNKLRDAEKYTQARRMEKKVDSLIKKANAFERKCMQAWRKANPSVKKTTRKRAARKSPRKARKASSKRRTRKARKGGRK